MIVCLIGTLYNFKNIKYNILKKKKWLEINIDTILDY